MIWNAVSIVFLLHLRHKPFWFWSIHFFFFLLKGLDFWQGRLVFEYIEIWDLEKLQNVCVSVLLCDWMVGKKVFISVKVVPKCKLAIWLWHWVIVLVKKKKVKQTSWVASKIQSWFPPGKSHELPYCLPKAFIILSILKHNVGSSLAA